MKKLILALAAALALCAPAGTVKFATREWVIKQFAAYGIRISTATVSTNIPAAVATNIPEGTNAKVYTSAYHDDDYPEIQAISFVIGVSTNAPTRRLLMRGRSSTPPPTITITLYGGNVLANDVYFPFDDVFTFDFQIELPSMPDPTHECEPDPANNCICKYFGVEPDVPDEYSAPADPDGAWGNTESWINLDTWEYTYTDRRTGETVYYLPVVTEDGGEYKLAFDKLWNESDAWQDAVLDAIDQVKDWYDLCRQAYILSQTCENSLEQHDWDTQHCGGNSWDICLNGCGSSRGTEKHSGHTAPDGQCYCGATTTPHTLTETAKTAKAGNTGWTQRIYCEGCGRTIRQIDHTCKHVNCAACSAGDDCNWPCPTCNGHHDFPYVATGDRCARCGCDGCGQTESAALGTHTEGLHSGWHCCGYKDGDDDLSNGDHCECECGDFKHPNDGHDREVKDKPEYRPIDGNDERHYIINMTECKRCKDPYGILEGHTWLSDETGAPGHKWLDNEKCAEKDECVDCGYEKVQSADEAGGHEPDGDPMSYDNIDAATCRRWYICLNCEGVYYDDEHGHSLGDEPVRHENVSDEICRAIRECEHDCGYEEADDTGGHEEGEPIEYKSISDSVCRMKWLCANGCGYEGHTDTTHVRGPDCVCENCHTYEFEHSFKPDDPCGNESCEFCGEPKPNTNPTHSGWISDGPGGHTCACGYVTEGHAMAQTGFSQSDSGWTITLTCSKCGFVDTRSHTHHFTNCGTCDAGDNCTVPCTGCKGRHKFGTRTNYSCAKCECPTCPDCDARPSDISLHTGWAPCSEDVEADNYDGTASGGHCQCACLFYGHNAGTGHDYQHVSGASEYTPYDEQSHLHLVGKCSRCGKLRKEKDPHSIPSEPIRYGTGSEEHCPAIFECSQCGYELELDYGGHQFDGGDTRIETYGGVTHIITTYTCIRCGYSYDDESELACYHKEVILENGEPVSFGASLWYDCVCSNCNTNRNHSFGGTPINEPGRCAMLQCQNENGDGSLCSATTNTIQGTHVGWSYIDDSLHECACTLRRDGHAIESVTNATFACVIDEICGGNSATNGCGHVFGSTHNADLVYCGQNAFCSICKRKRTIGEDGETVWVAGDGTDHCWDGQPADVRTKCACDCGLEVMHYFAPDRAGCGCECGETFDHIAGNDPTCKCTGAGPSHTKVLIKHGALTTQTSSVTNRCSSCSKNWVDKVHTFICTVCGDEAGSSTERGSHICKGNWKQTAGTLTYSWEGYTYKEVNATTGEEEEITIEGGSETSSWSGGGFSSAPPGKGAGAPAASSVSASGSEIWIDQSGTYKLRAKIDDGGSVSVGGLSASGPYYAYGAWVEGHLSEGPVSVSASADSVGGVCGFDYELQLVSADE